MTSGSQQQCTRLPACLRRGCCVYMLDVGAVGGLPDQGGGRPLPGDDVTLLDGCREAEAAAARSAADVALYQRRALELAVLAHGGQVQPHQQLLGRGVTHIVALLPLAMSPERLGGGRGAVTPAQVLASLHRAAGGGSGAEGAVGDGAATAGGGAAAQRMMRHLQHRLMAGGQRLGDWDPPSSAGGRLPEGRNPPKPVHLVDAR